MRPISTTPYKHHLEQTGDFDEAPISTISKMGNLMYLFLKKRCPFFTIFFKNFELFEGSSPLSLPSNLTITEIIGAKSELWTRFLPQSIMHWPKTQHTQNQRGLDELAKRDEEKMREIVQTWLEKARHDIGNYMPKEQSKN